MSIIINPSDSSEYPITNSTSGSTTLSIGYIKSRIGTGNFILYWQGSNYAIARLTDTTGDVYLADALHVGFLDDDDKIFVNGVNQKENFRYGYDPNTGGFTIIYGTGLNFSSRVYGGKVYIYYPVANASHPQVGVFTSYATLYINNEPVVQYVWASVPAISGKNGILSLTTLKEESINDGSPVNDASASAFNNAPDSCSVGGIISAILPIIEGDPTSVAIKYNIPSPIDSTYTSVKLVAKKKKIPKSKTDGDKIIDISPSSGSVTVNNLDEQTKYYFAIFVEDNFGNKADSEPKDITTGEKPKKWKETISYLKMITG